ncbi:MAG: ribonuclease Z, partial [Lachnospiraceae bacterium]|nr:ribonuclease Z [Lachnospiraceae bacterium]
GLPGRLLAMGNAERTEPLTVIGPRGVARVVNSRRVVAPELPFEIRFIELTERQQELTVGPYTVTAFRVNHNIVCYGYSVQLKRAGKFQVEKAQAANIPLKYWSRLQKGAVIEADGVTYTPDMVMGPERRGLKVTYCTDTRPVPVIAEMASEADLFICEGMYGEPDKEAKAKEHKHMTFYEAAHLAREADCKEMWLTHYSPSLPRPEDYMDAVRKIFPRSVAGKDGKSVELRFDDEE